MRNAKYTFILLAAVLAGCTHQSQATPDGVTMDYDPNYRTRMIMQNAANDHCGKYGKVAVMVDDMDKGDGSGDRTVRFNCVKQ